MSPFDRALERREAERTQERATEWSIVLRRPSDGPAVALERGIDAFYNLLQPALGYYDRQTETRGNVTFTGDEEGRGVVLESDPMQGNPRDGFWRNSKAASVGVGKASLDVEIEHNEYAVVSASPELSYQLIIKLRSDEPWEAQQRWWQLAVANFEPLGFEDATLAHWLVINLLKTLRTFGEIGALMQYIAIATRHAFDELAAADGGSTLRIQFRPYLDFEAALGSITHTDEVRFIWVDYNDMTAVPSALSRFPSLEELHILNNPLPPSERARVEELVPAGCKIS